jgi:hypothetical protein
MKWHDFNHQGTVYELSHLHPFEWHYTAEGVEGRRPERIYKFHVTFSMHCFSRDPLIGETIDCNLWYTGLKEKRLFCFDRHEYSKQLPDIIQSLGDRACWHSHHGNFFTIEVMTSKGEPVEYEVYFDVTRATRKGWLNLVIESAYVRTDDYKSTQPRKRKIRLDVIAYSRQQKKKLRPGR